MATNMFLKIEDPPITGECAVAGHEGEIEVMSWSHGFVQPTSPTRVSAGSGTVERANHHDFTFSKYIDGATDELLTNCWQGNQIGKCTFTAFRADGANQPVKYLEVIMEKVIISSISIGGGGGDVAVETISLNYGKVTYHYIQQKTEDGTADGVQPAIHDLTLQEVS